jgi:ribosomal protein S18 acetylase RimI-like enzyme
MAGSEPRATATPAIRSLRPEEVEAAGALMGRAFFDDPGATFVEPDRARRAEANGAVFAAVLRHVLRVGEVLTTDDLAGIAAWLPPDNPTPEAADLLAAGFDRAIAVMGPEASARMATMGAHFETLHEAAVDRPHWRLELLGVAPERQGQGIASALIAPGHARADARGDACYLETFTDYDVAFYRRRGYEVMVERPLPGTGILVRGMTRLPRPPDRPEA